MPRAGYRSEWQIDGWEKDTNARRWRRRINTRWNINSFPVAIIISACMPVMHIAVAVIATSSVFVTVVVVISRTFVADGGRHVHTADHYG